MGSDMPHRRHGSGRFSFTWFGWRVPHFWTRPASRSRKCLITKFPSRPMSGASQQRHVISRSTVSGPASTLNALQFEQWNEDGWAATMIDTPLVPALIKVPLPFRGLSLFLVLVPIHRRSPTPGSANSLGRLNRPARTFLARARPRTRA